MLSDRPYMREDYQRERTSFLVWFLSALVAGFLVQVASETLLHTPGFQRLTALSAGVLRDGYAWTLVTFPFLHRGALHLIAVGLALFFVARELTSVVGERRLAGLALAASVVGGLAWFAVHYGRGGDLMGASAILWCYFTVFACLYPNREISFLVFFLIPVTTRPKYILWGLFAFDVFGLIGDELQTGRFDLPHSAHLGAMLVGWIYYRHFHQANWLVLRPRTEIDLPRWMKRGRKAAPAAAKPAAPAPAAPTSRQDLRAEVDRILDKINSHGFNALTAEEKRVLDDARDLLSRR